MCFWRILVRFWPPFWFPLLPFWFPVPPFGNPLAPFWIPLAPFWLSLARFWFPNLWKNFLNTFSKAPEDNTTHPGLRAPPSLWARSGTLPQANSIRSRPEGAQGVLAFAAFSISFSFSSVSLSSIFDLIVFPGPSGRLPHRVFSLFLLFSFFFCWFIFYLWPYSVLGAPRQSSAPGLFLFVSHVFVVEFLLTFHILFGSFVWWFFIFWLLLFRAWFLYRFFIDFVMDFGLTFDVFLIPLPFAYATF